MVGQGEWAEDRGQSCLARAYEKPYEMVFLESLFEIQLLKTEFREELFVIKNVKIEGSLSSLLLLQNRTAP